MISRFSISKVVPARTRLHDRARRMVKAAIKRGKMQRRPCEVCGAHNAQAHHTNYFRPLDVQWLCAKHHQQEHRDAKNA